MWPPILNFDFVYKEEVKELFPSLDKDFLDRENATEEQEQDFRKLDKFIENQYMDAKGLCIKYIERSNDSNFKVYFYAGIR